MLAYTGDAILRVVGGDLFEFLGNEDGVDSCDVREAAWAGGVVYKVLCIRCDVVVGVDVVLICTDLILCCFFLLFEVVCAQDQVIASQHVEGFFECYAPCNVPVWAYKQIMEVFLAGVVGLLTSVACCGVFVVVVVVVVVLILVIVVFCVGWAIIYIVCGGREVICGGRAIVSAGSHHLHDHDWFVEGGEVFVELFDDFFVLLHVV